MKCRPPSRRSASRPLSAPSPAWLSARVVLIMLELSGGTMPTAPLLHDVLLAHHWESPLVSPVTGAWPGLLTTSATAAPTRTCKSVQVVLVALHTISARRAIRELTSRSSWRRRSSSSSGLGGGSSSSGSSQSRSGSLSRSGSRNQSRARGRSRSCHCRDLASPIVPNATAMLAVKKRCSS